MPPKQKEQKKGLNYRVSIPTKDIVPSNIKQPPRQPRLIKPIDNFPEIIKKNDFQLKQKIELWPGNQAAKTFDFGIQSTVAFKDNSTNLIKSFLKNSNKIIQWKTIKEIQDLQKIHKVQYQKAIQTQNHTRSLHQIKYVYQENQLEKKQLTLLESYMRDQTPQEIQKRKKQEQQKAQKAAKDKKKASMKKPEEIKQQGPIKIKDVELSDIIIEQYMLKQSKWIGSQLQLIKDRKILDIYNQQPIWKKIYPQVDGMPVFSKSGRYWVKLYYMGKQIKIQIDDQMPIDSQICYLFPMSSKRNQRWPLIITKALLKLAYINNPQYSLVGNGLILYSLTGLISQKISLNKFQYWDKVNELLNDKHYLFKDVFLTCYKTDSFALTPSSNKIKNPHEMSKKLQFHNSEFKKNNNQEKSVSSNEITQKEIEQQQNQHEIKEQKILQQINSEIIPGYSYLIGDHLFNDNFNMVYVQKRSNRQLKYRLEYNQLTKISLNNKGRQQKLEHRKKKKQLKQKIMIQQQKRMQLINKPPKPYNFLKICSDVKIHCEYSTEQIYLAKKCILNQLSKPPNYDVPGDSKQQSKSAKSYTVVQKQKQQKQQMILKPIDDFSALPNIVQILKRNESGVWIKDEDFLESFEFLQIFYDPNKLQEKLVTKIEYSNYSEYTVDQSKEILMLEKIQNNQNEQIKVIFGFSPQYSGGASQMKPYTILQKFNFQDFVTIDNTQMLTQNLSCIRLNLKNQNHIFKILTLNKGGYCYWIASNAKFRLMSILNFLTQFEGYTSKNLTIQYPPIQAEKYNIYFRLKLQSTTNNTIMVKLKGIDPYILKSLRYKLVCVSENNKYMNNDVEGINQNKYQKIFIISSYLRLQLQANRKYYLLLEGTLPFNINQGTIQVQTFIKNPNLNLEVIEQVQPTKYLQKYNPNKYGIIFRQRLFTNNDNVATLFFKILNGQIVNNTNITDKKAAKKGGKQQQLEILQSPLKEKRPIRIQLYCNDQLVVSQNGYNQALLSNIILNNTKGSQKNYYIQALFDLREWPQAKLNNQDTNKIYWSLKVFSFDSIAIVRDTTKQDKQKQIKKGWEDNQPGRAQRAKKSRRRYLIQLKFQNGQQLTQQQQQILNAPRLTKKQQLQEQKKANQEKKGKGAKKQDKKGKDSKKQEAPKQIEQKVRQLPKSQDNIMIEVKSFLKKLQGERIIYQKIEPNEFGRIRTQEDLRSIKQNSLMAQQQLVGILQRNIQQRQLTKIHQKQQKLKLNNFIAQKKQQLKKIWQVYIKIRNQLFEKSKSKTEKEKILIDLAKSQKPTMTEADIQKVLNQYQSDQLHNKFLVDVIHMVKKNIRISNLSDKLNTALSSFDIDEVNRIDQQIKKDSVQGITVQLMQSMKDLIQQAKKNPNYILEKQTELKKGKKGKK